MTLQTSCRALPWLVLLIVVSFSGESPIVAGVIPSFKGIGLLSGKSRSEATAISADGKVVVGFSGNLTVGVEGFRWTSSTGIVSLGGPFLPAQYNIYPTAISSNGNVVVGYLDSRTQLSILPFRWSPTTDIENLVPAFEGYAFDVSAEGSFIAGQDLDGSGRAYRWDAASGRTSLDPAAVASTRATAISADGQIIAGFGDFGGDLGAFRWSSANGVEYLASLTGQNVTRALGISGDGRVIVGTDNTLGPFRWTSDIGITPLGFSGDARSASFDGSVIVGGFDEAFIWQEGIGSQRITDFLESRGLASSLTGWTLLSATGVSDDGSVIIGTGRNPLGHVEAWVAVVPENSVFSVTLSLFTACLFFCFFRHYVVTRWKMESSSS